MTGRPQLYLLELLIAMLCVGASTLLMHRGFEVMVIKAFVVAFVAVAVGLAFFWIYFVPRAREKHQRVLGFATSLIVGLGLAPWVVEPIAAPLFLDRAESFPLFSSDMIENFGTGPVWINAIPISEIESLRKKLEKDGFKLRQKGNTESYSRRAVRVELIEIFQGGERRGFVGRIGWRAQGLWFQAHETEAEGEAYLNELEAWDYQFRNPKAQKN